MKIRQLDKEFLRLSAPIIFQNGIKASFQALDSVLISRLGTWALASAGFTAQIMGIGLMILFASSAALQPVISQAIQSKHQEAKAWAFVWKSTWILLLLGLFLAGVGFFSLDLLLDWGGLSPDVKVAAREYLLASLPMLPAMAMALPLEAALRSKRKIKLDMQIRMFGLFVNAILSILLIHGLWGAPAMGVAGAGIGSSVSKILEAILLIFVCKRINPTTRSITSIPKDWWNFVIKSLSSLWVQEIAWAMTMLLWMRYFADLGTNSLALWQIVTQIDTILIWSSTGFSAAGGIIIGKELGRQNFIRSYRVSKRILKICLLAGLAVMPLVWLFKPVLFMVFDLETSLHVQASELYFLFVLGIPIRMLSMVALLAMLRSGGIFFHSAAGEIVMCWLFSMPAMELLRRSGHATESGYYLIVQITWLLMLLWYLALVFKKSWLKQVSTETLVAD